MKTFLINYGDSTETLDFPSKRLLLNHLHHKLNKRRLHGIEIAEIKNNSKGHEDPLRPIGQTDPSQEKCFYCKKSYPAEEITLDDSLVANNICEGCYKFDRQL